MRKLLLTFDICHRANVVLCSQHELIVDDPIGLVVETSRRMQLHVLVVLDGQIVASALQVGHLHEEALHEGLSDVYIVVLRGEFSARAPQVEAVHDSSQLLAHVIRTL